MASIQTMSDSELKTLYGVLAALCVVGIYLAYKQIPNSYQSKLGLVGPLFFLILTIVFICGAVDPNLIKVQSPTATTATSQMRR